MRNFLNISLLTVMLITLSACSNEIVAEKTYTIPAVEGQKEIVEDASTIRLETDGYYPIGKDLESSGDEEEFTTGQSGNYVVGEDIKPGVYDIEAQSGTGTIETENDYMMIGVGDKYYSETIKNVTLYENETISVSGVVTKFVPASGSEDVLPAATYDLEAVKGTGTIETNDMYEMIGVGDSYYSPSYDNLSLESGDILNLDGVTVDLIPTETKIVVQEEVEAVDEYDVTEKVINKDDTNYCYIDDEEAKCSQMQYYDELAEEINEQK